MSRFSRIKHHLNIEDVKERHLKNKHAQILENKRREEEEKYVESAMKQIKYSWREYDAAAELREGMTTSNLTITTVAAQGEGEDSLATLDMSVADSFSDNTFFQMHQLSFLIILATYVITNAGQYVYS